MHLTRAVDDHMQLLGDVRLLSDPPRESKGRGVEQPPSGLGAPIVWRLLPSFENFPDPLHPNDYEREDFVFDPLHYLALIEQKINALDQAAPLANWQLPEEFATLRRLLEARMGKQGKREFVQVLRLMEVFRAVEVAAAVRDAIARGAIGFDAVKHLVLCRVERRPPRLDMTVYPYLPKAHVAMTLAKTYLGLLTGAAS